MSTQRTTRTGSKKIRLSDVKAEDLNRIVGGAGNEDGGLQGTLGSEDRDREQGNRG